jgi:hypothetical protein
VTRDHAPTRRSNVECAREGDVFEAIAFGRWPDHVDRDLRAHVARCVVCRDVVDVAAALHADREALMRGAQPPSAAIVWWRATIRARAEAAQTAMQPMTLWQGIAGACAVGVIAAIVGGLWSAGGAGSIAAGLLTRFVSGRANAGAALDPGLGLAAIALAGIVACLVVAPIALYIALADD